ncbi:MAG: DUF4224 domain-containing protein [Oceanococcaceae bacterium]
MRAGPLSPAELQAITHRKLRSKQADALRDMGIPHTIRPDGTPLVLWEWLAGMHAPEQHGPSNQPDFSRVR